MPAGCAGGSPPRRREPSTNAAAWSTVPATWPQEVQEPSNSIAGAAGSTASTSAIRALNPAVGTVVIEWRGSRRAGGCSATSAMPIGLPSRV